MKLSKIKKYNKDQEKHTVLIRLNKTDFKILSKYAAQNGLSFNKLINLMIKDNTQYFFNNLKGDK
jgi:predicted DNA binding CopG/RHH family protein